MAFLGGLMRGVPGAFIRGSLDTATNIIQASEERGEENIVEKIKDFGARKAAYDKGVNEYTSETRKLQDIAGILQGDAELKDRSMDELMGVAQQLLTIDSSNPLKYFQENRDDFNFTKIDSQTTSVEDQTDAVMQTATAPASGTADTGGVGQFVGRLLSGPSEKEQVAEAAKRLGITPDMYLRIMAGKVPTRAAPTLRVSLAAPDPLEGLIKDTNASVMTFFQKDSFRQMKSVPFPTGNETPDGDVEYINIKPSEFARTVMDAHSNYIRTGEDGAELHALQHYALSLAMPKDVSNAFGMFDATIKRIDKALESDKTPDAVHTGLFAVQDEINKLIIRAATEPGFGSGGTELQQMQELIVKGQGLIRQIPSAEGGQTLSLQGTVVQDAMKNIIARSQKAGPNDAAFKDKFAAEIAALPGQFSDAIGDPTKLTALAEHIAKLQVDAFGEPRGNAPGDREQEVAATVTMLSKFPRFKSLSPKELQQAAREFHILNPRGPKKGTDGREYITVMSGGEPVDVYIGTEVSPGFNIDISANTATEHRNALKTNAGSLNTLAKITSTVVDNPLVFTAFGEWAVRGSTYADVAGKFTGTNMGSLYANYFNVPDIAEARRQAIELVGSSKDRLFDDPRLSDQDLKLVLQYIAVLEQGGLGTGSVQAVAALQGLQIALLKDTAMRTYDLTPRETRQIVPGSADVSTGSMSFYDDAGNFSDDASIATKLYKQVASAYNMPIESMTTVRNMPEKERDLYLAKQGMIQSMVENALHDIVSYEALGIEEMSRPSSLPEMGTVDSNGKLTVQGVSGTFKVQSLASAKLAAGV